MLVRGQVVAGRPRLGFFPGSTIGNLENAAAIKLLANMARMLGADGRLVIGADLKKDERRLIAAYDDAAVTPAASSSEVTAHPQLAEVKKTAAS